MDRLAIVLLVPPAAAIACASLPAGWRRTTSAIASALTLVLVLGVAWRVLENGPWTIAGGWLHVDALAALLAIAIAVAGTACAWYGGAVPIASESPYRHVGASQFESLFQSLVGLLLLAAFANDLGLLWIAVEGTTLAAALLIGWERRAGAVEAAWKYLVLSSVGITLALFATVLLHHASVPVLGVHGHGLQWTVLRDVAGRLDPRVVQLAFLFALVGYGTKAGLAPMHTALPDAEGEAPAPAAALLSAALLPTALVALVRFHVVAQGAGGGWSGGLLVFFGLFSMAVATPFLLLQGQYPRLLAYSSIEHTGFTAFAVGLGGPLAVVGGLLHLLVHALGKTLAFLVGGTLEAALGSRRMDHWNGVLARVPARGVLFVCAGVAITGLPPLALFLSEWLVISGGFAAGRVLPVTIALAALGLSFVGLAYHWTRVALGQPRMAEAPPPIIPGSLAPLWGLVGLLAILGTWLPPPLRRLIEEAARVVLP